MGKQQAKEIIKDTLEQSFDKEMNKCLRIWASFTGS